MATRERAVMKQVLIIFLIIFIHIVSAKAEDGLSSEDKNMVYDLANKYSVCGGNYYAASEYMKSVGKENAAADLNAQGNGHFMAGAWLLYKTATIPNWQNALRYAEASATTEKQHLLAILETSSNIEDNLGGIISTIRGECAAIDGFQQQLVAEMRKFMYENASKKPQ